MDTLSLIIVTPQRQILETEAQWVDIPAESGMMRALPQHAPLLGLLGSGEVRYQDAGGKEATYHVAGGFVEVLGMGVTLLADEARPL